MFFSRETRIQSLSRNVYTAKLTAGEHDISYRYVFQALLHPVPPVSTNSGDKGFRRYRRQRRASANVRLVHASRAICPIILGPAAVLRELLQDGVAVKAAVRSSSVQKANVLFKDKAFMPEGQNRLPQRLLFFLCEICQTPASPALGHRSSPMQTRPRRENATILV